MSVLDQLITGLELTVTGMVTVFLLLTFMVLVIHS
jgi:Na+-transporting methylmalonyl-CoA/oxaloacetate decarboxylase gamma subunit